MKIKHTSWTAFKFITSALLLQCYFHTTNSFIVPSSSARLGTLCGARARCSGKAAVRASTSSNIQLNNTNKNIENFAIDNNNKKRNDNIKKNGPLSTLKKALFLSLLLINAYVLKFKEFLTQKSSDFLKIITKYFPNSGGKALSASQDKAAPIAKLKRFMKEGKIPITKSSVMAIPFLYLFYAFFFGSKSRPLEISFVNFLRLIEKSPGRVNELRVTSSAFSYLIDGRRALTRIVDLDPRLLSSLLNSGLDFAVAPAPVNVLGILWACVYAFFIWNVSSRMMQGPQDAGAGSRKDLTITEKLSFEDVAGQEQAKLEVKEVCDMLRAPLRYKAIGARFPAGVLLVGPPGTGKTLLARVTASEAKVPFYACSASDFVEVFVGRGPARVRKLFKQAAENAPCIVFIDELDSIGRSRRMGSLNSEQESTLNQLLTSMDGLDTSNNGVIVMAATNRYELLDPALLRAGRFDRIIQCPLPDKEGRESILGVHTRKLQLSQDVDLKKISAMTAGTCGSDLSAITNEAAIRTVRRGGVEVSAADFDGALKSFRMRFSELDPRRYI